MNAIDPAEFFNIDPIAALADGAAKTAYDRDGVVHLRQVLSDAEVAKLRRAVDAQFAGKRRSASAYDFQELADQYWRRGERFHSETATRFDLDRLTDIVAGDADARPIYDEMGEAGDGAGDASFFYEAAGWRRHAGIREVAFDSSLPEIAARLLGSAYVNFWEDTTFVKTPGATLRTPFHQDYTYFQISGGKCCIVWIPLDPTTAENGALEYVIGSHRWGRAFAPSVFVSQSPMPDSPYPRLPDIERCRDAYDIRAIYAEPGDIIVHDVMVVHGSGGNRSAGQNRRGISFRYCGDDIRYVDKPGATKQPWVRRKPNDGDPLYSADFPRVWPRPFPGARLSQLFADAQSG